MQVCNPTLVFTRPKRRSDGRKKNWAYYRYMHVRSASYTYVLFATFCYIPLSRYAQRNISIRNPSVHAHTLAQICAHTRTHTHYKVCAQPTQFGRDLIRSGDPIVFTKPEKSSSGSKKKGNKKGAVKKKTSRILRFRKEGLKPNFLYFLTKMSKQLHKYL